MSSIVEHQLWPAIKPYVRIQVYDRDGGHEHARIRIELDPLPADLHRLAVAATMPCVACGDRIHPFRKRVTGSGHLYYACSCPLDVSVGCSRGSAASEEYERVREDCEGNAERKAERMGDQVALFGAPGPHALDAQAALDSAAALRDPPRPMTLREVAEAELAILRAGARNIGQRASRTARSMYAVLQSFAGGRAQREVRR